MQQIGPEALALSTIVSQLLPDALEALVRLIRWPKKDVHKSVKNDRCRGEQVGVW
jgi:hypothetical protein